MRVLTLNSGSSSLKATVRTDRIELRALAERLGDEGARLQIDADQVAFDGTGPAAVSAIADALAERGLAVDAVAHRIVHGGPRHPDHTVVDDAVLDDLRATIPLAPLHLPPALDVLDTARRRWSRAVQVACFDTAFFRALPEVAVRLPVPVELVEAGVRRYGFHGLSVQSALRSEPAAGNVVVAHLGSGCSVTAVDADGRPQHTTMSMTPTAGMMSGTRTGDLDPEVALYLADQCGYTVERLRVLFNQHSGLAGIAGGRHDMRVLRDASDHEARLAIEAFVRSAAMAIAACATTLPGWDTLVFTGGIGEHDSVTRDQILARLRLPESVTVEVKAADEEGEMNRITRRLVPADHSLT